MFRSAALSIFLITLVTCTSGSFLGITAEPAADITDCKLMQGTILYVDPSVTLLPVSNISKVNVAVADVVDLFGFQFYFGYDTTILDILGVAIQFPFEGSYEINETGGYVYAMGIVLIGYPTFNGSAPLVSITFEAVSLGGCKLHLYDTNLVDSTLNPIPHTITDGWVFGDVDGDGKIEIIDLVLVVKAYGSYPGHPRWNPNADTNCDGKVDIQDLVLLIKHFGEHYL